MPYDIAENLLTYLQNKGMTQASFARKVGLSKQTINNICTQTYFPNITTLYAICVKSGLSLDYLCGLSKEPERNC